MEGDDEISAIDVAIQNPGRSNGTFLDTTPLPRKRGRPLKNPSQAGSQTRSGRTPKRRRETDYEPSSEDSSDDVDMEPEASHEYTPTGQQSSDEENDPEWSDTRTTRRRGRPTSYNVRALMKEEMSKPRPSRGRGRPRGSMARKPNPRLPQFSGHLPEDPVKKELDFFLSKMPDHKADQPDEAERIFTSKIYHLVEGASGGFQYFVQSITDGITLDVYTFVADRYAFPDEANDELKIVQSLRHVWNRVPAGTRLNWERAARQLAKDSAKQAKSLDSVLAIAGISSPHEEYPTMPLNEIPFKSARRLSSTAIAPLCCPDADVWQNFEDVKRHMMHRHYSAHFYACHFCLTMYSTKQQLLSHTCSPFSQFMLNRIIGGKIEQPDMKVAYIFLTCYDCGLWVPIRQSYTGDRLEQAWAFFSTICRFHSTETLNLLVVYAIDTVPEESESVFTFRFTPPTITNLPLSCPHCKNVDFSTAAEANAHMLTHEQLSCKCGQKCGTEPHMRAHIFSHLPSKLVFGRYLRDTACVYPPTYSKGLPRVGFNKDGVTAVGGYKGIVEESPFEFVDHCDPLEREKMKNSMEKRKLVDDEDDTGFSEEQGRPDVGLETADYASMTTDAAEDKAKLMLNKLFAKQMAEKNQLGWSDEVKNWAEILKKMGVSPASDDEQLDEMTKEAAIPHNSLIEELVRLADTTVALPTQACFDSLSDGIFNKNYDICDECNVIFETGTYMHGCEESKVFRVYNVETAPNSRISCHLCDETVCSIYGLRNHLAWDHLRHVEYKLSSPDQGKKQSLMALAMESMPRDFRSVVTKRTDIVLRLAASGGTLKPKFRPNFTPGSFYSRPPQLQPAVRRPMVAGDARRYPVTQRPIAHHGLPPTQPRPATVKPYLESTNGYVGYTCRFCQFSTQDMRKMREHLRVAHTIICRGCGQAFAYQNTLIEHEKVCPKPFGKVPVGNMHGKCACCRRMDPVPRLYTHIFESHLNLICYGTSCGKIYRKDTNQLFVKDIYVPNHNGRAIAAAMQSIPLQVPPPPRRNNTGTAIECYLCGFESPNMAEYQKHLQRHPENWTMCPFCYPVVPIGSHDEMKHHLMATHFTCKDAEAHVCNACHQVLDRRNVSHLIYGCAHTGRCALCPYSAGRCQFETPDEMRAHWRLSHGKQFNRFGCSECKAKFPSLGAFRNHTCRTVEMVHRCECGQTFETRGDFVDHFWNHVNPERTSCLICRAQFSATYTVAQHRMNHGKLAGNQKLRKIRILDESLFIEDCKVVEVVELDNDDDSSAASSPALPSISSAVDNPELSIQKVVKKLVKDVCHELGERDDGAGNDDDITALEASVRTEDEEVVVINSHPGYVEDDLECCPSPVPDRSTPVLREVVDDNADEDIAVVAEVDNPSGSTISTVSSTVREKKFKCGMCSLSFLTKAALTEHEVRSHKNDVGGILDKAYGVPIEGHFWLCRNCCAAFESPAAFRKHSAAHGINSGISCPHCSGISYNIPLFEQHQACHKKTDKTRMYFGCGTCSKMFLTDSRLYHHMNTVHRVPLLFFCKNCAICSANLGMMLDHVNKTQLCRTAMTKKGMKFLQMLGAFPANLVHYQPLNPENYEVCVRSNVIRAVTPSECAHRSFLTLTDSVITCKECHCTMSSAGFYANEAYLNNGKMKEVTITVDESTEFPFHKEYQNHQISKHRMIYNQATAVVQPLNPYARIDARSSAPRYMPLPPVNQQHQQQSGMQPRNIPVAQRAPGGAVTIRPGIVHPPPVQRQGGVRTNVAPGPSGNNANKPTQRVRTNLDNDIITIDDGPPSTSSASPSPAPTPAPVLVPVTVTHNPPRVVVATPAPPPAPIVVARSGAPPRAPATVAPASSAGPSHCGVCKAQMSGPKVKRLHELHRSGKAWFCLDCANGHRSEVDAVKHYYAAHIQEGQKNHAAKGLPGEYRPMVFDLKCPVAECRKPLKTLNELRKHLDSTHTDILKFSSEYCSVKFATEQAKNAHEQEHQKFEEENGVSGVCCQLCGVANQWNLQCEVMGTQKMISHLAVHGLHTYSMCRDCFTCFPGDFDNTKMIKHFTNAHVTPAGAGRVRCTLCAEELTKDALGAHGMEKHIVRGYKTRQKAQHQLMIRATGVTRHFMGLPQIPDDKDEN